MAKTSRDGKPNACSADYCNVCKQANALKEKRRMCKHELLDIWSDASRAPVAVEQDPEPTKAFLAEHPECYANCAHCGLEVSPNAAPGNPV